MRMENLNPLWGSKSSVHFGGCWVLASASFRIRNIEQEVVKATTMLRLRVSLSMLPCRSPFSYAALVESILNSLIVVFIIDHVEYANEKKKNG